MLGGQLLNTSAERWISHLYIYWYSFSFLVELNIIDRLVGTPSVHNLHTVFYLGQKLIFILNFVTDYIYKQAII